MRADAQKTYFAFNKGLNTEAPMIAFPDGYTTDESNYELLVDGSRRRRLGIARETLGENIDVSSHYTLGDAVRNFDWENVAGVPTINYMVKQVGYMLYIFDDANPTSPTLKAVTIDIRPYSVSSATDEQIAQSPVESAFGRGHLFLFGKYINSFYIEFDPDTELFTVNQIDIMERDFQGIDDGYTVSDRPTSTTDAHTYNLRNRGWTAEFLSDFLADQGNYPSKAMSPWLGLKRALTAGNSYDNDGVRTFSPQKLVAELFQDASAPTGHFIKTPFDTTSSPDSNSSMPIETWDILDMDNGPQTVIITTTDAHGLVPTDSIEIEGIRAQYNTDPTYPILPFFTIDGTFTVNATPSADSFEITVNVNLSWPWFSWYDQYQSLGSVIGGNVPNPSGDVVDFRPKAGAFFAGRVWFAGIDTARLTGRIYFSQVIEADAQYGKCYQVADPTDERISDLVPSDGGVIVIPEASNVLKLVPYGSILLVMASNGVWEIGPGESGYFTADSYSVRKITDSGATGSGGVVLMDNVPVYWGVTDIYAIQQNPQTGYLQETNISQAVINTFYNDVPLDQRRAVQGVYDDLNKRVIWIYGDDSVYTEALLFDARLGAFTAYSFASDSDNYIVSLFLLKEAGQESKLKIDAITNTDEITICEFNSTTYEDLGVGEAEAFMVGGFDSLQDPSMFKHAPYVYVFSRKTETGYGPAPDYEPIRASSTTMQARWDWADNSNAGKWGTSQQVYRHARLYIPSDPTTDTFDTGVPVLVTRNQVRGRGRVLQLRFSAGSGKDSWIAGVKILFNQVNN